MNPIAAFISLPTIPLLAMWLSLGMVLRPVDGEGPDIYAAVSGTAGYVLVLMRPATKFHADHPIVTTPSCDIQFTAGAPIPPTGKNPYAGCAQNVTGAELVFAYAYGKVSRYHFNSLSTST